MPQLTSAPPVTTVEPVTEVLHGVTVTDPYRWLEDQDSPRTREWLAEQYVYARTYLDSIPGRIKIRERVRELLDVETYDSMQQSGSRYFFRKRNPGQEQPCIYFRDGSDGADQLLIDPADRGTGPYTSVKPLRVSPDGRLLLYEVKEGGERTSTFELLEISTRRILPDILPRGYLRGFVFSPDSKSFYYAHEALTAQQSHHHAVLHHVLDRRLSDDEEFFTAGDNENLRLCLISDRERIGIIVYRFGDPTLTDFFLGRINSNSLPSHLVRKSASKFAPMLCADGRILAVTNQEAPNFKIVELRSRTDSDIEVVDIIGETECPIQEWSIAESKIYVSYFRNLRTEVNIFDLEGKHIGEMPVDSMDTIHLHSGPDSKEDLLFERESFTKPLQTCLYSSQSNEITVLVKKSVSFASNEFSHARVSFRAKDGVPIPMTIVGRKDILRDRLRPTVMTSYGGFGVPTTPQFSVFGAFLMERGCLLALPNIRGGSEFGSKWHDAAKRRRRWVAIDDFVAAGAWLVESGWTAKDKLAIFGGSNSGLLVGAALTQQPDLFRAVVCMVPMLDMLRYHRFDGSHVWKEEFGTVDDAADFEALLSYSPYHNVQDRAAYPATMIVSGDADRNCNGLHARKMTARLQAAHRSENPMILEYSEHRGHSPVLPLSMRLEALTDRMAFLCHQLQLEV